MADRKSCAKFQGENLKARDHLENLGLDGELI